MVKNISDRVAVMYLGKICEVAASDELYQDPAHPYTVALLKSIPVPDPTVRPDPEDRIEGEPPSPVFPPPAAGSAPAARWRRSAAPLEEPQLRDLGGGHYVACHFPVGHEEAPPVAIGDQRGRRRDLISPALARLHRQGGTNVGAVTGNEPSQG